MEAFLISTGVVALAEIGDKTQLLALVLAAKFRKPVPIILGILAATLVNHAMAGAAGAWISAAIGPVAMRWILGISFIAMAAWTLIPDKLDDEGDRDKARPVRRIRNHPRRVLSARDGGQDPDRHGRARREVFVSVAVVAGTTLGMMLANVPAVLLGEVAAKKLPMKVVHRTAAGIFFVLGVSVLLGFGSLA